MNCDEVRKVMEDYHDGEIDPPLVGEIASHLALCRECGDLLRQLEDESRVYRRYAAFLDERLEAGPAVWKRIEVAAAEPRRGAAGAVARLFGGRRLFPVTGWARQLSYAVLLVVASVSLTLLVGRFWTRQGGQENGVAGGLAVVTSAPPGSLAEALRSIQHAEQEYVDAINVLSSIVEERRPSLDPALLVELDRNLKAIDEAIAVTRKAYYQHPTDPDLAYYMLTAYSRKVELLQQLTS